MGSIKAYAFCLCAISAISVVFWNLSTPNDPIFKTVRVREYLTRNIHKTSTLTEKCKNELKTENNCQKLFLDGTLGNGETTSKTIISTNCSFSKLVRNCSLLIGAHEYITDPSDVTIEERAFPLAFTIKIHDSPDQMEQLFRNIYRPQNVYCIHVDKKSDNKIYRDVKKLGSCFPNVYVLSERINVVYRSIRMLDAEFLCMQKLIDLSVPWKYYINLAGQEFPLKTNLEIVNILKILNGRNVICSVPFTYRERRRIKWRYDIINNNLVSTNISKEPFPNITVVKANTYGFFIKPFVRFVLQDSLAQRYIHWLRDTLIPDESIWGTLSELPRAPGGNMARECISRAILWLSPKSPSCSGEFVREVCVYGVGDLPSLHTTHSLIANKFSYQLDRTSEDCLEELIRNRTRNPALSFGTVDWQFYKRLEQHLRNLSGTTNV